MFFFVEGGVLTVELGEQAVKAGLLGLERRRRNEERLGADREEFLERLGSVRIEERLVVAVGAAREALVLEDERAQPPPARMSMTCANSWMTTL